MTDRWAWVEVDLGAIEHNISLLIDEVSPAAVWAVVKANGYGHGAIQVAQRALSSGAQGLCVALLDEGVQLRAAGIEEPILILSEQPNDQLESLIGHGLTPTVYSGKYAEALADLTTSELGVHVKIDTGMQRVGVDIGHVGDLLQCIEALSPPLRLDGFYTHLACADEPDDPATNQQLREFDSVLTDLDLAGLPNLLVHTANSAAGLAFPAARRSFIRAGIAMYGISPGAGVDHLASGLRPVLSLKARVSFVKDVAAGSAVSYGGRHRFDADSRVATVPIGYADGVPRRLGTTPGLPGTDVLIGGHRRPIVGAVTMDQIVVEIGDDDVTVGDEVVLIGSQGRVEIRAEDWADRLGTIGYEIVCGISQRVPRVYSN